MNNFSGLDSNKDLEIQMGNMCGFLEKLIVDEEKQDQNMDAGTYKNVADMQVVEQQAAFRGAHYSGVPLSAQCIVNLPPTQMIPIQYNFNIPQLPQNSVHFPLRNCGLPGVFANNSSTNVTSVLAAASTTNENSSKFNECPQFARQKRWMYSNQIDRDPDTSHIDIDATMIELGLTPEALTQNEVYKLFSLFSDLDFMIHADYIANSVYDKKNVPNTMSVSAQIKYAVWRSHTLLRELRNVLERPMPAEYLQAYTKCKEALDALSMAIMKLQPFRYCTLEHRKGEFVTQEAQEYIGPIMDAMNCLIECVGKSRMYVQVYERALNAPERYKPTPLQVACEEKPQPLPDQTVSEGEVVKSRPLLARRYIG